MLSLTSSSQSGRTWGSKRYHQNLPVLLNRQVHPNVPRHHLSLSTCEGPASDTCPLALSHLTISSPVSASQSLIHPLGKKKKKLSQITLDSSCIKFLQSLNKFHKYLTSKLIYVKIRTYLINVNQFNKSCPVLINAGLGLDFLQRVYT